MKPTNAQKRERRHIRIRARVSGTATRPRLVAIRSLKNNSAQLVDDTAGKVLAAATDAAIKDGTKTERARKVGEQIAKLAAAKGITTCVFDRNGYKYHGRVQALAEGARSGGLVF